MKSKAGHQNRFLRIITIPIRALGKARDFYVRSMTSYATKVGYGNSYMGTTSTNYTTGLPKSFSVNSSRPDDNDDLRELIRAASVRSLAGRLDINELILQQQMMARGQQPAASRLSAVGPKGMPPRSCSVGMGRIDEEKPYAVGEISSKSSKKSQGTYGRSRSYAVNKNRSLVF